MEDDARNYTNYMNDLNANKAMFDQQTLLERSMIENAFNNMLRTEVLRLAEDSSLKPGVGTTPDNAPSPVVNKNPTPKPPKPKETKPTSSSKNPKPPTWSDGIGKPPKKKPKGKN